MAHLLGFESCLDSLSQDVSDIQAVVMDITSRAGPVRSPSWKYPDKISSELDIDELLEMYCYSEEQDHCKLSHIVLFELVIDRLVLLLQGASQFVDQLLRSSDSEHHPGSSRVIGSAISVGLVAKKFWSKIVKIQQMTQQAHFEAKAKADTLGKMEDTITELQDEVKMLRKALDAKGEGRAVSGKIKGKGKSSATSSARFILSPHESISLRSPSPANDITLSVEDVTLAKTLKEKSTQTYDTAFIPCEACSRTQKHLIEVGNMVMRLCESQGLPSSLAKQKKLLRKSLMAAADISRWTSEQNQDLARINDHLDNLYAQINPLEAKLKNSQNNCKHLEHQIQGLEDELVVEKEEGLKREETIKTEFQKVVEEKDFLLAGASEVNQKLKQGNEVLQGKTEELGETLAKQEEKLSELEKRNFQLKTNLERESNEVKRLRNVDEDILNLKVALNEVQIKLRETSLELDKSQAKNRSLTKHEQALQSKHDSLLQRVDDLDNECEELRERLMEAESDRDDLQDALEKKEQRHTELKSRLDEKKKVIYEIQEEKKALLNDLEELQANCQKLQGQIRENEEKMKILSEYPAMDTENTSKHSVNDENHIAEMDVVRDMERQVMANNIRILMLEEQNEKLRKSITLLMSAAENEQKKTPQSPVSLWKNQSPEKQRRPQSRASGTGCYVEKKKNASFTIQPRPPSKPRNDSAKSRHKSANVISIEKRNSVSLSSKLASSTSEQTKRRLEQQVDRDLGSHSSNTTKAGGATRPSGYSAVDVFICSSCDKIYHSQKDLDIHKSFCYGNITGLS